MSFRIGESRLGFHPGYPLTSSTLAPANRNTLSTIDASSSLRDSTELRTRVRTMIELPSDLIIARLFEVSTTVGNSGIKRVAPFGHAVTPLIRSSCTTSGINPEGLAT